MYNLSITHNQQTVDEYTLRHEVVTVGRSRDNDIQLNDTTVSQRHAQFLVSAHALIIEDVGSTNGTYVNGQRIKRQQLRFGDVVMIGQHKLVFGRAGFNPQHDDQDPTLQMSHHTIEQFLFEGQARGRHATPHTQGAKAINWVAQDQDGVWWGFEQQPVANTSGWTNFQDTMKLRLKQETPNPEWRETLHKV